MLRRWIYKLQSHLIAPALATPTPASSHLPAMTCTRQSFDSLEAFRHDRHTKQATFDAMRHFERALDALVKFKSVDYVCEVHQGTAPYHMPDGLDIHWREGIPCEACRLNARMRFSLALMRERAPAGEASRAYLTEQSTYGYVAARKLFSQVTGSEYVTDPARRGAVTEYIRLITADRSQVLNHQDVTALTYDDASFDVIGSFEVLEHVPDYRQALREMARVLSPGGVLVLTAPFLLWHQETTVRARLHDDGTIEHLATPEYHGDPVADNGVLCFYHFGWDLLDTLRQCGFSTASVVTAWSPAMGYLGDMSAVVATR